MGGRGEGRTERGKVGGEGRGGAGGDGGDEKAVEEECEIFGIAEMILFVLIVFFGCKGNKWFQFKCESFPLFSKNMSRDKKKKKNKK